MDMHASKTLCTGLYKSRCLNSYYSIEDLSLALEKKKKLIRVVLRRVKPCVVLLFMAGTYNPIYIHIKILPHKRESKTINQD
jgi:hypothetical protein